MDIMNRWTPYKELYKTLNRNFCIAYSFRKKRIKEEEAKERITMEEMRLNNEKEISIKKLELEHGSTISGGDSGPSGTSTPISWSSPSPQLSKKDISEFKPKNSLSAELTYLEMQDWRDKTLNWFKIGNHATLEASMQRHLLKNVVDSDMWVKAKYKFEDEDTHEAMVLKLCTQFEESVPLFIRRQQFFDTRRGKTESLHSYMIKLELQAMAANLDKINLHELLCHKLMSDEGPDFRKKVVSLKTATGEPNMNPSYKELMNLASLEYREKVMMSENKKLVNNTGGGQTRCERKKKSKGFMKCFSCGANGHKSNACTVEKSALACSFCQNTNSHNTAACRKKDAEKKKKSPASSPHRERSQSPAGGRHSQTPATALSTNSAIVRHNLNRVGVKYHKDVENKSFTMNSLKSSGKLRKLTAKMSAARTGRTSKETITLDSGASCLIARLDIAKKLNLNLRPAPGVTITGAGGESLEVAGQTDVFFSVFDNTPVRLHIFVTPDLYKDILISADHMEDLSLIPVQWPECMNEGHRGQS